MIKKRKLVDPLSENDVWWLMVLVLIIEIFRFSRLVLLILKFFVKKSGLMVVRMLVAIQSTGFRSVFCFCTHKSFMIFTRFYSARSIGSLSFSMAVCLAVHTLRNILSMKFFNFNSCMKERRDVDNVFIIWVWLEVTKKHRRGILVWWCLMLMTYLVKKSISSISQNISGAGVEGWRFVTATLNLFFVLELIGVK